MIIRTRFAPSPTGYLHVGGLRTAAYAYAMAKHEGGSFLLRIEDTDQKREVKGASQKIYDILDSFGLTPDEGPVQGGPHSPYIQSARVPTGIYKQAAQKLLDEGHAFYCFCKALTKEEIKQNQAKKKIEFRDPCRNLTKEQIDQNLKDGLIPAIRLKTPDKETISYHDFVLDRDIKWNTSFVDDAMLLKSDGFPTYHLAVVVDDSDMQITHIIRAAEWQPSTPIHLLVYKYLGLPLPQIGHPTAILDPAGGKLSKRKGNVSVEQFIEDGYLPEALFNFVILLGWAPKNNQDLFTKEQFIESFDTNGFQKSNPIFDTKKLDWLNGHYIREKSDEELLTLLKPFLTTNIDSSLLLKIIPLAKERLTTLKDFESLTRFFFAKLDPPAELSDFDPNFLKDAYAVLENSPWDKISIEAGLQDLTDAKSYHRGQFFMALRLAVASSRITPPLTESMLILGKDEVLRRLRAALGLT